MIRAALIALFALLGGSALAQERITADEFLDIAQGRTLTFHDFKSGYPVGVEQFLTRKLSVWKETGGQCVYGTITIEEGKLCFKYDHRPDKACWWPYRDDERLFVLFANRLSGEIQEVVEISDAPVGCPMKPSV